MGFEKRTFLWKMAQVKKLFIRSRNVKYEMAVNFRSTTTNLELETLRLLFIKSEVDKQIPVDLFS